MHGMSIWVSHNNIWAFVRSYRILIEAEAIIMQLTSNVDKQAWKRTTIYTTLLHFNTKVIINILQLFNEDCSRKEYIGDLVAVYFTHTTYIYIFFTLPPMNVYILCTLPLIDFTFLTTHTNIFELNIYMNVQNTQNL